MLGFSREAVEAVGGNWNAVRQFNDVLARLTEQRKARIDSQEWLVFRTVIFQQAMLYRIVALASGCSTAWNARNILVSVLCARAIMESVAVFLDFRTQLLRFVAAGQPDNIFELVRNRTFATKLKSWVTAETSAVNVQTMIGKLEKLISGAENHYARLSEMCHPNYMGTFMAFASVDTMRGITTFSEDALFVEGIFDHVFVAFGLIGLVENAASQIDEALPRIAEL